MHRERKKRSTCKVTKRAGPGEKLRHRRAHEGTLPRDLHPLLGQLLPKPQQACRGEGLDPDVLSVCVCVRPPVLLAFAPVLSLSPHRPGHLGSRDELTLFRHVSPVNFSLPQRGLTRAAGHSAPDLWRAWQQGGEGQPGATVTSLP